MAGPGPDDQTLLRSCARQVGLTLSERALSRLLDYLDLLSRWNLSMRLTGTKRRSEMIQVHLMDSFAWSGRLLERLAAGNVAAPRIIDVGTGAGLPGVVLGALEPALPLELCEPMEKRVAFLQAVKSALRLGFTIQHCRVEALIQNGCTYDHAVSRATFPTTKWQPLGRQLAGKNGVIWYLMTARQFREHPIPGEIWPYSLPDGRARVIVAEPA